MSLTIPDTADGYKKARLIKSLLSLVELYQLQDHFDSEQISQLRSELVAFLARSGEADNEYEKELESIIHSHQPALRDWLRKLFGPSRQELNLSKQREALIERAEHAESSAFEALAELTDAAKSRDQALARIKQLESELKS